eukprot:m51a1_g13670 hypothetical protein (290) ;mRNA; f:165-1034
MARSVATARRRVAELAAAAGGASRGRTRMCVVAGDSPLLALEAHAAEFARTTCLVSSEGSEALHRAYLLANGAAEVLATSDDAASASVLRTFPTDVLVAEPFFDGLAGQWELAHACCFWGFCGEVRASSMAPTSLLPRSARVHAVLFCCRGLWDTSRPVESCCGVSTRSYSDALFPSDAATAGRPSAVDYAAWAAVGLREVGAEFAVLPLDFGDEMKDAGRTLEVDVPEGETVHGLLLWVAYEPVWWKDRGSQAHAAVFFGEATVGPKKLKTRVQFTAEDMDLTTTVLP